MNFVHIADMHFDSPFVNLADKEGFGDIRRMDQRNAFKKLITYIKENKIPYLFISGDMYEHKYVKKSTIQYSVLIVQWFHPRTRFLCYDLSCDAYIIV